MTGLPEWNYAAFFEAEERLRSLGHEVINPARIHGDDLEACVQAAGNPNNPNHEWDWYMRQHLRSLMDAESIYCLKGWRESRGATLEVQVATALGMTVVADE